MNSQTQVAAEGFAGQVLGTSLPDLIQMQCLTLASRAVRVDAESVTGRIYFSGGQVIHATVGMLTGEAALFEMLRWKNGTFDFEDSHAAQETVTRHWQSILLEAAQREDELAGGDVAPSYPSVVALPETLMTKNPIHELRSDPDVVSFVQSDIEGTLLESHSDDPENLQAGFAYVLQLLQLAGTSLGAETLREVHFQGKEHRALCVLDHEHVTAVVTSPRANLAALSKKLI